jgi:hypothetical protein
MQPDFAGLHERRRKQKMRRITIALLSLLALAGLSIWIVLAESPHFIRAGASCSGNNLKVCFKEAGLDGNPVTIRLQATGTATYQCFNNGGNHPKAGNKTTVSSIQVASGTFYPQNGQVTNCLTIAPPGPGGFTCPPGQNLVGPTNVSYSNLSLTDTTNNVAAGGLPSSVSCP